MLGAMHQHHMDWLILVLRLCCSAGAYVGGAEVLGSVLKDSQLPHVQQILGSSDMLAQLDEHHLLRLVKAFLQVGQLDGIWHGPLKRDRPQLLPPATVTCYTGTEFPLLDQPSVQC